MSEVKVVLVEVEMVEGRTIIHPQVLIIKPLQVEVLTLVVEVVEALSLHKEILALLDLVALE